MIWPYTLHNLDNAIYLFPTPRRPPAYEIQPRDPTGSLADHQSAHGTLAHERICWAFSAYHGQMGPFATGAYPNLMVDDSLWSFSPFKGAIWGKIVIFRHAQYW